MDELLKVFLQYGVVGAVAILALLVAFRLYKDTKAAGQARLDDAKAHNEALVKLAADQKNEMKALEERYITKAERWMEKNYDLARELAQIAELLERRWGVD